MAILPVTVIINSEFKITTYYFKFTGDAIIM